MTDKELLSNIQEIQNLMIHVSTGSFFNEETDNVYKNLYFKIKAAFKARSVKINNTFGSLAEFYKYWSENLPTYKDRRYYVHSLYKDAEENLYLGIEATKPDEDMYSISIDDLHEDIVRKCKEDFINGKYDEAVSNSLKLLEIKVRAKAGFDISFYGRSLMESAFNPQNTPFQIEGTASDIQGWSEIFKGVIGAIRNPLSHRTLDLKKREAFQILCFVSYLLSFVDNLSIKKTESEFSDTDIPF